MKVELDEMFEVDLSNVSAAGRAVFLGDGQGVGTILNDDLASISIDDVSAVEGDAGTTLFTFTVTLDSDVDTGLSVDFATTDDTATTADSDYAATAGTLNFFGTAGETQTLSVSVTGDTKSRVGRDVPRRLEQRVCERSLGVLGRRSGRRDDPE